jgi:hypothetical protein
MHSATGIVAERAAAEKPPTTLRSWRDYRP